MIQTRRDEALSVSLFLSLRLLSLSPPLLSLFLLFSPPPSPHTHTLAPPHALSISGRHDDPNMLEDLARGRHPALRHGFRGRDRLDVHHRRLRVRVAHILVSAALVRGALVLRKTARVRGWHGVEVAVGAHLEDAGVCQRRACSQGEGRGSQYVKIRVLMLTLCSPQL